MFRWSADFSLERGRSVRKLVRGLPVRLLSTNDWRTGSPRTGSGLQIRAPAQNPRSGKKTFLKMEETCFQLRLILEREQK